jgi:mono/diheme cytochrome c family protein
MKKTSRWIIGRGVLFIVTAALLTACGGDQPAPPPVAATSTPLPPPPTEAPTSTPLPTATDIPEPTPTEVPTSTPPLPTDTPQAVPAAASVTSAPPPEEVEKSPTELAEAANEIYTQGSCVACHGVNHEGGLGSILVGLPAEYIQVMTRSGVPEAGMPAFDQNAISDDDLSTLAEFLSELTLQDTGVELSPTIVDHLNEASDALEAGDKAAVETHLEKAQEAAADSSAGLQATLKSLVGGLGEPDWMKTTEFHLEVLLAQ